MAQYTKIYLKLFLGMLLLSLPTSVVGILLLGFVLSFLIPVTGDPEIVTFVRDIASFIGVIVFLLMVVFFSGWITIALGTAHIAAVKKSGFANVEGAFNVRHKRLITLKLPYDEVFAICLSSLKVVNDSQVIKHDRSKGIIEAKTGISWKTWGDKISFQLLSQSDGRIVIEISSRPTLPTTLVDYGRNLNNVECLVSFIKRNSEQSQGSLPPGNI